MGQKVSKSAVAAAQQVSKKKPQTQRPPAAPPIRPQPNPLSEVADKMEVLSQQHQEQQHRNTTDVNPGRFLRGDGVAKNDIRDVGQEMFLMEKHKLSTSEGESSPAARLHEMPDDLLKFIQDVGPAQQEIDKEQTSPRLLEKENEVELQKAESVRRQRSRERTRMPLMGEDQSFTTTRNTNFSRNSNKASDKNDEIDFGITNLQLFDLLYNYSASSDDVDSYIDGYYKKMIKDEEGRSLWRQEEIDKQKVLLKQSLEAVDLPVLRQDPDGNFIALYPNDVPGTEVKTLRPVSTNKVCLVLDDILNGGNATMQKARDNLILSREARRTKGQPVV